MIRFASNTTDGKHNFGLRTEIKMVHKAVRKSFLLHHSILTTYTILIPYISLDVLQYMQKFSKVKFRKGRVKFEFGVKP